MNIILCILGLVVKSVDLWRYDVATLQIQIDDVLKQAADNLFMSFGMDTSTAVRVFLNMAVENDGIPFPISHRVPKEDLFQAIEDAHAGKNIYGPFRTGEEAVASMLED